MARSDGLEAGRLNAPALVAGVLAVLLLLLVVRYRRRGDAKRRAPRPSVARPLADLLEALDAACHAPAAGLHPDAAALRAQVAPPLQSLHDAYWDLARLYPNYETGEGQEVVAAALYESLAEIEPAARAGAVAAKLCLEIVPDGPSAEWARTLEESLFRVADGVRTLGVALGHE